jgi:hypothetical protein
MIEQQTPTVESERAESRARPRWAPIRARAWIVGLLLVPLLNYASEYTEIVSQGPSLVSMSLPVGCAFVLLVLVGVNLLLKRFVPKAAFTQAELLLVFFMNSVSIGIGGIGWMQILTPSLVGWFHFADNVNHWNLWHYMLRPWAVVSTDVIPGYYTGGMNWYARKVLLGWAAPIAVWSGFIAAFYCAMFCIAVLVRRQWVENERLSFPIVQIPLAITENGGDTPLWRNRMLWAGVIIPVLLETLNTLHYTLYPTLPSVDLKGDAGNQIDNLFTQPPLNGMGGTYMSFYPVVIGLTYLLPVDVSFSCWFFYLMTKVENIMTVVFGFRSGGAGPTEAAFPFVNEQAIGAFVGLALLAIYWGRPAFRASFRRAFLGDRTVDETDEPIGYRAAYLGLLAATCVLIAFGMALGLSLLVSAEFFLLFLIMVLAVTRIRAEAGMPWVFGPDHGVHYALTNFGGTAAFKPQELVALSQLSWTTTDWRCLPQAHQLEAMKLAGSPEGLRINPRLVLAAVIIATIVALASGWINCLNIYYTYGGDTARLESWRTQLGNYPYQDLQDWLNHRKFPLEGRLAGAVFGVVVVAILSFFRTRFYWWPFHPMGYAVANTGTMPGIWMPMLIGWLAKSLIVRYGGVRGYRIGLPFFLGLMIGEYAMAGILAIISIVTKSPGYRTFP